VIDSPGALRFCDVGRPWRANYRFVGSVELKWGINAGVTFVSDPGPEILATYTVTNADITSGIVQFVNPGRTTFGSGSAAVQLLSPGATYAGNNEQLDIRIAKVFQFGGTTRLRFTLDLANMLNAANVFTQNNAYGTSWLKPTNVLPGRLIKPGVQLEF